VLHIAIIYSASWIIPYIQSSPFQDNYNAPEQESQLPGFLYFLLYSRRHATILDLWETTNTSTVFQEVTRHLGQLI